MSDDLVKRLRDTPNWMREGYQHWKDNVRTYDRAPFEAADRIEALEAALLAADELAQAVDGLHDSTGLSSLALTEALAAYRRATGGGT